MRAMSSFLWRVTQLKTFWSVLSYYSAFLQEKHFWDAKKGTNTSYEFLVILMITWNTTCSGFLTAVSKKDTIWSCGSSKVVTCPTHFLLRAHNKSDSCCLDSFHLRGFFFLVLSYSPKGWCAFSYFWGYLNRSLKREKLLTCLGWKKTECLCHSSWLLLVKI